MKPRQQEALKRIETEHATLVSQVAAWLDQPSKELRSKIEMAAIKHSDTLYGILAGERYDQ
jgi:hypothetical protein